MPTRKASAEWQGPLKQGRGKMKLGSGAFEGNYSFGSRFEDAPGTNPEELIGAAQAGCFSMALAHGLAQAGYEPRRIETAAEVDLAKQGDDFVIASIHLSCRAEVPEITEETFQEHARDAKQNCPVSRALGGLKLELDARLTT